LPPVGVGYDAFKRNLIALTRLLEEDDENDRLLKADVFRELGEFEAAKDLPAGRVGAVPRDAPATP
jgi:hypothetical protein